jgi:archaeosine synthase beta-subunit
VSRIRRQGLHVASATCSAQRFHRPSLEYLLERTAELPQLEVLSLETRPEYIRPDRLVDVRARTRAPLIDLTVGFETRDDSIRMGVLRKKTSRRLMEERIRVLGELGMRLTSYTPT